MAASLLGTFTAAEGAGAPTTGSRTTTAGSLICAHGGASSGASDEVITFSDNKSNTITKALQHAIRPSTVSYYLALGYNMAGTRGVTHTLSMNDNGGNSLGGTEWDGIAASPTVVTSTNSGNGTGPTASLSVAAASLFIGQCGYAATATTIAVSDGTEAIEIDEDNSRMSDNVAYKVGQTGSPSVGWTLGASRDWITIGVSFTEAGGAVAAAPTLYTRMLMGAGI